MATLTLKNVPDELYQRLKELAAEHRRSLNQEAIERLSVSVTVARSRAEQMAALERAAQFRERLQRSGVWFDHATIKELIEEGRP